MLVAKDVVIGLGTKIWNPQLVNIYGDCIIGSGCNIGSFVEIGPGVKIGDRVRIGAFTFIPEGITIEDDVFIGPGCVFTNDKYPPSHKKDWLKTLVKKNASIGAGCVICPGVTIGEGAMVGAGTAVSKDVPAGSLVVGASMRWLGVDKCSDKTRQD
jgi:acetyltransferase-like isoleucine patch superfamily enzyme